MPTFTVETTYCVPNYRQRSFTTERVEQACRLAIDDDDWSGEIPDCENAGATYVTGIWEGKRAAYSGPVVSIPGAFADAVRLKLDLFDELLAVLREAAKPMGLSRHDFEGWLSRAVTALAKADAITGPNEGRRDG